MNTLTILFIFTILSWPINANNDPEDFLYPNEATLVNSVTEPSGLTESYFEITRNNNLVFELKRDRDPIISIIPLLTSDHVDDVDIRILIESDDGCDRSVYKLSGSRSTELQCDSYPDLICGEKYTFSNKSKGEGKSYKVSLLSGCDLALIQLKTPAIRA